MGHATINEFTDCTLVKGVLGLSGPNIGALMISIGFPLKGSIRVTIRDLYIKVL